MLYTYFILVTLFMIELVSAIAPLLNDVENMGVRQSYVIKNKKILTNAVYVFEKRSLPLCSRRYQKISNGACTSKLCDVKDHSEINPYTFASSAQELRDFCIADSQHDKTS
jgi:hypothetical protein